MTTTLWLRISSVLSLLFAAGHTSGGLKNWSPMGENTVLQAMRTVRFDAMGANRSYFDFYMGFGWSLRHPASSLGGLFSRYRPSSRWYWWSAWRWPMS
jgi:hypothetical protein